MKFFPFHTFFIIQIILFPRKYNFAKIIISHKKNRRQVIFESSDKKIPKKFFVCNIIYVFLILYFIQHIFLYGGIFLSNNIDMNQLLSMLSKMDKKDLHKGMEQATKILNSNKKNDILNNIKNNNKDN